MIELVTVFLIGLLCGWIFSHLRKPLFLQEPLRRLDIRGIKTWDEVQEWVKLSKAEAQREYDQQVIGINEAAFQWAIQVNDGPQPIIKED